MVRFTYFFFLFTVFGMLSSLGQEIKYTSGWYAVTPSEVATESSMHYFNEIYIIEKLPIVSLSEVQEVHLIKSRTRPYEQIEFIFTDEGAKKWEIGTEKYAGKKIGFIYENRLLETLGLCCKISSGKCSFGFSDDTIDIRTLFKDLQKSIEAK